MSQLINLRVKSNSLSRGAITSQPTEVEPGLEERLLINLPGWGGVSLNSERSDPWWSPSPWNLHLVVYTGAGEQSSSSR